MVNLSASPWNHGKGDVRHKLVADTARQLGCPVAYVNAIGGNDELLFDGRSVVCDAAGKVIGGLAAMLMAVAERDWFWIANVLYLCFMLSAVTESIARISAYRGGLPQW